MTKKVIDYRNKHKKCLYCKYLKYSSFISSCGFYKCEAKDKIIKDSMPNMLNVPRWFCSCYELDIK